MQSQTFSTQSSDYARDAWESVRTFIPALHWVAADVAAEQLGCVRSWATAEVTTASSPSRNGHTVARGQGYVGPRDFPVADQE